MYEKFSLEKTECVVITTDTKNTFLRLNFDGKPSIKYSLKLLENLDYKMWCADLSIKKRHIENIDFKHITSFSTLCKILSPLDDAYEYKIRGQLNEEDLVEEALKLIKTPKLSGNKKISFLIEQLSILFRKPVQLRYSSSLFAMAVMWQNISPAT